MVMERLVLLRFADIVFESNGTNTKITHQENSTLPKFIVSFQKYPNNAINTSNICK